MIFVTDDTLLTFVSLYNRGLSHLKKKEFTCREESKHTEN